MNRRHQATSEFLLLAGASTLAAIILGAAGYVPTHRWAGDTGLAAMAGGIACALVASIFGAAIIALNRSTSPASRQVAVMGAMAARLFVTLGVFAVVVLSDFLARKPFAIWTGISYLALLAVETGTAVLLMRRREGTAQ